MSHAKKHHFCTSEGILNQEKLAINACIFSGKEFPHSLGRFWKMRKLPHFPRPQTPFKTKRFLEGF
jgi:hypothetical protein